MSQLTETIAGLLQDLAPCPLCSYYRRNHAELGGDVLAIPHVVKGSAGRWRMLGCPHASQFFGPHDTAEEALEIWKEEVVRLAEIKRARQESIAESVARVTARPALAPQDATQGVLC